MTRIKHITASFHQGGAAAAATRIARGAQVFVDECSGVDGSGQSPRFRRLPSWLAVRIQLSNNPVHRSLNVLPSKVVMDADLASFDVAHLHWVGDEMISIGQIGSLAQTLPVVWTLHDTWAFTGADHHPKDGTDTRYRVGYTKESRLPGDKRVDVDAWVFRRKLRAWKSPVWLVAPSSHVMKMAQESFLASRWPVTVIPNPIDCDVFTSACPQERTDLRHRLGLHGDEPLILLGSGSRAAYTKGMDLLASALPELRRRLPHACFVTFGPDSNELPDWVRQIGFVHDESALRDLYAAADVVLVSSRFETFSQVAAEAQACGTPVAAFGTSGLLDVVSDGETGYLAKGFDPVSLVDAAQRVLDAGEPMRHAASERAQRLWAMPVVGRQYADWYEHAIREFHERKQSR
mgnify:CR=1 FL=1